jgi:hypothetical protein
MNCKVTETGKIKICPEEDKISKSTKEIWYAQRRYCLDICKQCKTDDLLKKIYWELRKIK